jgi:class 3 adenylate cyclase/putative methionine-R-sulfoxide reductase with GAF domain
MYFLIISSIIRNKKPVLFLSLVVFNVSIRSLLKIEYFFEDINQNDFLLRIDHLTYYGGFPFFIIFCYEFFKTKFHPLVVKFITYYSIPFIILLFIPGKYYIEYRIFYHIAGLIVSLYLVYITFSYFFLKEKYAKIRFLGIFILFLGFAGDIYVVENLNSDPFIIPIVMVFFSLSYSLFINYELGQQKNQLLKLQEELIQAKEEVQQQYETTKEQEEKLQKLNLLYESLLELSKKISTISDFNLILDEIAHHFEINFGIKYFVLMTIDPEKQEAYFFNSNLNKKLTPEQFEFMTKGVDVFDLKQKGIHYGVFHHKKAIYLKNFKKSNYEFENQLVEKLNLKSLIVFPLIYQDEVFGFLDITHADEPLNLSKEEYLNLNIFVQYFAQLFRNYLFFQEIQKQKIQLEEYNKEISKKNKFILEMNDVLSLILQSQNIREILDHVIKFLDKRFNLKYYILYFYDKENDCLVYSYTNGKSLLDKEKWNIIKNNKIPIFKGKGIHSIACKKNRYIYFSNALNRKTDCEIENQNQQIMQMKSILIFPLIVGNEIIGTFDISHIQEPIYINKVELTLIKIFIDQFASILKNLLLIQEIQNQKNQLEIINKEISERNQIILSMNATISLINQTYDIKQILNYMIEFLTKYFSIRYYLFFRYDKTKNQLIFTDANFEHLYEPETLKKIKSNIIPLDPPEGIHASCCIKRRFIYLPKLKTSASFIENENQKLLKMKSLMVFPLYAGNELLGTLDFSHFEEELKISKVQLTLIKIFVDQFASILKNKLLIDELETKQFELEKSLLQLEATKQELENLNEFTKKINSSTDFQEIIQDIFDYFNQKYDLKFGWLILIDEKEKAFKSLSFSKNFNELEPFIQEFLKNFNAPLNETAGTLYRTYKKKKYFYAPKIFDSFQGSYWDHTIIEMLRLKWLLHMPLIVQDKVIGILAFTNFEKTVHLKLDKLKSIQYFCDQIAGALYTSYLLEQLQKEKQKTEMAQKELQKLNEFTRQIIEEEDFETIIQNIFDYLKKQYELQFGWLLLIDKKESLIKTSSFSKNVIEIPKEMFEYLSNFKHPIDENLGTIYRTIQRKKHLYLKRIDPEYKGAKIDEDLIKITKLKWVLYVPLILKNEVIGILAFTNYEKNVYLNIDAIRSIEAFCSQIVGAIYNSYLRKQIEEEKQKSDNLLLNILPKKVADELKEKGYVKPRLYKNATVLFTDFVGFTKYASEISPEDLIEVLDGYFHQFDEIITRNNLTKLKTIGDAYMAVGGIPEDNYTHAVDACLAALELRNFTIQTNKLRQEKNIPSLDIRIGINTGIVVAGIIGKERFAYDVWGDAVNVAQRLESSSLPYEINISRSTYEKVKYFFKCEYRGKYDVKNRGKIDMFFLKRIHPKLSKDEDGFVPNERFLELYKKLKKGAKFVYKHELKFNPTQPIL